MKPIRKILVPVDFSAHADHALRVAAELARRFAATLTLVHVHEPVLYALPDSFILYPSDQVEATLGAFRGKLEQIRDVLLAEGAQNVDTQVLSGVPVSAIVEYAESQDYDLIVMGTHGRTGLSHALIGSVAERVVRKAPCPVMTVRLQEEPAIAAGA